MDSVHQSPSQSSRKRSRESETESQRIKREKAAERQRRKRERDRKSAAALQHQGQVPHAQQQQAMPPQQQLPPPSQQAAPSASPDEYAHQQELSPEEIVRREKVRASARERQRKHRLLVKQKRMRELGLDMGNEVIPGLDEMQQYRAGPPPPDGQYHPPVLPPELHHLVPPPPPPGMVPPPQPHEPPFPAPAGAALGGQTFASTLLLSFSCAPLLKQHLLRTLHMTNDELASLEPIIAEAWDRWDHNRRMQYAEHVAKNGGQPPPMPPPPPNAYPLDLQGHDPHQPPPHGFPHPNGPGPADPVAVAAAAAAAGVPNEFRARFHRAIVDSTPFRNTFAAAPTQTANTTPSSTAGSTSQDAIDPHLATSNGTTPGTNETSKS